MNDLTPQLRAYLARMGIDPELWLRMRAEGKKRCTTCKRWKTYASFARDRSRGDGYNGRCRLCIREAQGSKTRIAYPMRRED